MAATGEQAVAWITREIGPLTDWQKSAVEQVFNPNFTSAVLVKPRRNGLAHLTKLIEQADRELGAS